MSGRVWQHDELLADLAGQLRSPERMVWTDMQLGPSGSPRPDVYTLRRSYSKPQPTAYEVKVSRSDLRSDMTSGKWQSYLKYAGSVTFAVPDGLCTPADIPAGCGLMVRKAEVWRHVRRATVQTVSLPMDAFMKLLIDGVSRVSVPPTPVARTLSYWKEQETVRRKFGDGVAAAARDLASVESRIAHLKAHEAAEYERVRREAEDRRTNLFNQARKDVAEYEAAKREICAWLQLPEDASVFAVRRALQRAKCDCDADARVSAAEQRLDTARRGLEHALSSIAPDRQGAAA